MQMNTKPNPLKKIMASQTPAAIAEPQTQSQTPRQGKTQLSVRISPELKQLTKLKAIQSGKSIEEVVSELLERWTKSE
jgi:predicted HicB family RNase H-like nuclease